MGQEFKGPKPVHDDRKGHSPDDSLCKLGICIEFLLDYKKPHYYKSMHKWRMDHITRLGGQSDNTK